MEKIRVYKSIDTARRSDLSARTTREYKDYTRITFTPDGGLKEFSRITDAYRDYQLSMEF